jgi:FkbM family methyltransferase
MRSLLARARDQYRLAKLIAFPSRHVSEELVLFRCLFWRLRNGVMVDIGAHWGNSLRPYALRGWQVYALEPDPNNRKRLRETWGTRPNVVIDERAVTERDGEKVALFTSAVSTGISGLTAFHSSHLHTSTVNTVRLATLCAELDIKRIDLLKVDVEGFDLSVLRSHEWNRVRPAVVMCEYEDRKTIPLGHTSSAVVSFLTNLGYRVLVSEWHPIVEYGGDHQWRRVYRAGEHEIPSSSWGNLIAIDAPESESRVLRGFPRLA